MRLGERGTVVPHGLIASVRILREDGDGGGDEDEDEVDEGEDGVDDEEDDAHDTRDDALLDTVDVSDEVQGSSSVDEPASHDTRGPTEVDTHGLIEDAGKDQEEDDVDEVDDGDGDVERVGLLVHPRSQDADCHEQASFDQHQGDRLGRSVLLDQGDEDGLDQDVCEDGDNEVVGRGTELNVEEAPSVEGVGIGVEDVAGVLMHTDRSPSDADDLPGCPEQGGRHGEEEKQGQDDLGRRIALGQLPEAQDAHLGEADEGLPWGSASRRDHRPTRTPRRGATGRPTKRKRIPLETVFQPRRKS